MAWTAANYVPFVPHLPWMAPRCGVRCHYGSQATCIPASVGFARPRALSHRFALRLRALSMPPRGDQAPAMQIAAGLRAVCWVRRHLRFGWLRGSNPDLAAHVARLMSPDELLAGTCTGSRPERVIPLPDRPRHPGEPIGRAVRPRLG